MIRRRVSVFLSLLAAVACIIGAVGVLPTPSLALTQPALIKTANSSSVYYVVNNKRYAFPNEKTFYAWYKDFSSVVVVSSQTMASFPLAKNVAYKPTGRLIKLTTDPKVYAVSCGGVLRGIASEQVAKQLWGNTWNTLVDDLSDAFLPTYTFGSSIATVSDFVADTVTTTIVANLACGSTTPSTNTNTNVNTNIPAPPIGTGAVGHTYKNSIMVGNCPLFSDQYLYYQRVDDPVKFPLLPNSVTMVKNMGLAGYDPVVSQETTMLRYVSDTQPLVSLMCTPGISWCPSTLIGGGTTVPYPGDLQISNNTDAHTYIIHETSGSPVGGVKNPITTPALAAGEKNCYLYETWRTAKSGSGFTAGALSVYDLKRDISYVPTQIGGSSASNLPVAAGIVHYDEAINDRINHAIGVAFPFTRFGYISPANTAQFPVHCTSAAPASLKSFPCDLYNPNLPAMGQRFRLRADYDETPYKNYPITLAIIHAMKKYGLIVTDGSGVFTFKLDLDPRFQQHQWPDIQSLKKDLPSNINPLPTKIPIQNFEAVQSGTVIDATNITQGTVNKPNSAIYN